MLTTIERLKSELGITDTADDSALASHLIAAESIIGERYSLPTVPITAATRSRFVDGSLLFLDECATVTAVADRYGNAIAYTAFPTDDGRVSHIELGWRVSGRVSVTGTWGYASTPPDVERAILLTAATYYRRSTYGGDDAPYRGGGSAIPTEAAATMDARRVRHL